MVRVLRSTTHSPLDSISAVLFPADCRVCGLPLTSFTLLPVCSSCWDNLPAQSGALCERCGEALSFDPAAGGEALCRPCRIAAPPFAKALAWGVYRDHLRTLLHLLKYDGMQPLSKRLGVLLAESIISLPELPGELIVAPVPLFGTKHRHRGFNQSELLARAAIPALRRRRPEMKLWVESGVLVRQRATESQAGLTPHQRRMNVRGAFSVARPETVRNRAVLLIDDIYTTGATARACAQALRRAGAAKVWVATVARAQKEESLWRSARANQAEIPMQEDVAFWDRSSTAR